MWEYLKEGSITDTLSFKKRVLTSHGYDLFAEVNLTKEILYKHFGSIMKSACDESLKIKLLDLAVGAQDVDTYALPAMDEIYMKTKDGREALYNFFFREIFPSGYDKSSSEDIQYVADKGHEVMRTRIYKTFNLAEFENMNYLNAEIQFLHDIFHKIHPNESGTNIEQISHILLFTTI